MNLIIVLLRIALSAVFAVAGATALENSRPESSKVKQIGFRPKELKK